MFRETDPRGRANTFPIGTPTRKHEGPNGIRRLTAIQRPGDRPLTTAIYVDPTGEASARGPVGGRLTHPAKLLRGGVQLGGGAAGGGGIAGAGGRLEPPHCRQDGRVGARALRALGLEALILKAHRREPLRGPLGRADGLAQTRRDGLECSGSGRIGQRGHGGGELTHGLGTHGRVRQVLLGTDGTPDRQGARRHRVGPAAPDEEAGDENQKHAGGRSHQASLEGWFRGIVDVRCVTGGWPGWAGGSVVRGAAGGTSRHAIAESTIERAGTTTGLFSVPMNDPSFPLALSYDDVLLAPQRSPIASRGDVDTTGRFTPRIFLRSPVVAANMDTVTEAPMAIAMARAGGIGVIHRFLTIDQQVAEVARTKRAEALVIDDPFTISPDLPISGAMDLIEVHGTGGLVVVDDDRRPVGMVTRRDLLLRDDLTQPVSSVMSPRERLVVAPSGIDEDDAARLLRDERIEKLPLVDDEGRLAGLITMRDLLQRKERPTATKDARGRLSVAAAIGVRGDYRERAKALVDAGADALVLDIAHGHMEQALDAVGVIAEIVAPVEVIAGNVATAEGARDLIAAGANAVKVGVGPGSACSTRVVAGVGIPQFTAVRECAEACHEHGIPVIADGGIRAGGDVAKAIGAGADTVMVGNLLAGSTESPGTVVRRGGAMVKVFRGMASAGAAAARRAIDGDAESALAREDQTDFSPIVPEGVEAVVPFRGGAAEVVGQLVGGLRSGMSYSNATTVPEMQRVARFVRITSAGLKESHPHDVTM